MEFKAIKPIGVMAVVTNPETREVEAVDMDTLKLYSLVVNHATKAMQLALVLGRGTDKSTNSRSFRSHPPLTISASLLCSSSTLRTKSVPWSVTVLPLSSQQQASQICRSPSTLAWIDRCEAGRLET